MHPDFIEFYAKEKQAMLLKEAQAGHMRKNARASEIKKRERLFIAVGELLVSLGYKLIDNHQEMVLGNPEPKKKCC